MQPSLTKARTKKDQGFKKESLQSWHENLKQSRPTHKLENELQGLYKGLAHLKDELEFSLK